MSKINPSDLPFNEAIEFFRKKLKITTSRWNEITGEVHARAFTVAGAMQADLLDDLYGAIQPGINAGESLGQFRKRFDKVVADHGWTYNGERGWRTRVIYNTNLRTAQMAGRWEQIQRTKKNRPYGQYMTAGDTRVRPDHVLWNGTILLLDDAWWDTHWPPNGWGCRCTVRTLSQQQMDKLGLTVSDAPDLNRGEFPPYTPKGIDKGWDYNVGKAYLGPDIDFGEKLMALPKPLRDQALTSAQDLSSALQAPFTPWVTKVLTRKKPQGEIKTVGYLKSNIVNELINRNQTPITAVITATDKDIVHAMRDIKDNKKVPLDLIRFLPEAITNPQAVLWDKRNPALLYIFNVPNDDKEAKLVIKINYKSKFIDEDGNRQTLTTNTIRSAGLVALENLTDSAVYDVIEGKL